MVDFMLCVFYCDLKKNPGKKSQQGTHLMMNLRLTGRNKCRALGTDGDVVVGATPFRLWDRRTPALADTPQSHNHKPSAVSSLWELLKKVISPSSSGQPLSNKMSNKGQKWCGPLTPVRDSSEGCTQLQSSLWSSEISL